jgi:ABC-type sugar transport system ATPase subunit
MRDTTRLLGIESFLDRRIDQLSGGQRQRVAIAKALVKRPKLFLLDEPFAALDAQLRRELRGELVRIHRELETTMLFVTHDQEEAIAIADRVAVMNKGELVQLGPALDIYTRPANTWIAGFVGPHSINFLDVELHSEDGRGFVNSAAGRLAVDPGAFAMVRQALRGSRAILGFRPEFTTLSAAPSPDAVAAEVYSRQNFGSAILYHLKSGGLDLRAVVPINQRFDIGQRVSLRLSWVQSVWFDPASKKLVLGPAEDSVELCREEVSL